MMSFKKTYQRRIVNLDLIKLVLLRLLKKEEEFADFSFINIT